VCSPEFLQLNQQQKSVSIQSVLQQHSWTDVAKNLGFSGKKQAINMLREATAVLLEVSKFHDGK
jgi:tRNA(Met) C34 N-acetyltransferase TmcA